MQARHSTKTTFKARNAAIGLAMLALIPLGAIAQVPVDEQGNVIGTYENQDAAQQTGNGDIPLLSQTELEELVGPIALYPDDLLAVVLPAATYPLQIVQAARFLEDLESDPSLEPSSEWDDSIVALTNYPEVVELLNEDLDWTWRLGEAVVAQQADVVGAVEAFRNRAYAAGNLKSDEHQNITQDEGIIEITPVNEEIIYVPYYEPSRVVYYQPRPVYHYYPHAYPVYYYPYHSGHAFNRGYFWGVTTAFSIGWASDHLRVFHHSYHGHPYYGHSYWDRWWYRRPALDIHNSIYVSHRSNIVANRHARGDYWRPSRDTRLRYSDQRITRSTHYPNRANPSTARTLNPTATASSRRQPAVNTGTRRDLAANQRRRQIIANEGNSRQGETFTSNQRERQLSVPNVNRNSMNRQVGTTGQRQQDARELVNRQQPAVSAYRRQEPAQRQVIKTPQRRDTNRQHVQSNRQTSRAPAPVSVQQQAPRQQTDRDDSRRSQNSDRSQPSGQRSSSREGTRRRER